MLRNEHFLLKDASERKKPAGRRSKLRAFAARGTGGVGGEEEVNEEGEGEGCGLLVAVTAGGVGGVAFVIVVKLLDLLGRQAR